MVPQSLCASTDVTAGQDAAMWATGTDHGNHYLMFAIHMVSFEVTCSTTEAQSAMIIPCAPYATATQSDWCRPSTGSLVASWLSTQASSSTSTTATSTSETNASSNGNSTKTSQTTGSSSNSTYATISDTTTTTGSSKTVLIVGIAGGAGVFLILLTLFCVCKRRQKQMKSSENTPRTYRSATTPNPHQNDFVNAQTQMTQLVATPASGLWGDPAIIVFRMPHEKVIVGSLINSFLAEAKIMASIEHVRLVPFVGVARDSLRDLCVVTKFMDGGDLRSLLKQFDDEKSRSQGCDADKIKIAMHIAHALAYLHSMKTPVLQRDMKSRNILLDSEWNAKFADFGISREASDDVTMTAGVGTTLWMAPAVMMGERYDEKADIFSFGVVLTELNSHQLPYASAKTTKSGRSRPDSAILHQESMGSLQAQFSPSVPQWMREVGTTCLSLNPASAAEMLFRLQTKMQ